MMKIYTRNIRRALLASTWLVATAASQAQAAAADPKGTEVEEVTVTARQRAENVQDVPLAISAVSGALLENKQIHNAQELSMIVPSLTYQSNGTSRTSAVSLRGIGVNSANGGVDSAVGVYFDGVYMPITAAALQADFLDISAIEVLRGPQGTLFGRNTPVGAINIRSRDPQQEREAMVLVGGGNYNTHYVSAFAGGGLTDDLAGRVSFYSNVHGGYDRNLYDNSRTNSADRWGVRAQLKWTPGENFIGRLSAFHNAQDNHCCTADDINPAGPGGLLTLNPGFNQTIINATGRPFLNLTGGDHVLDDANPGREKNYSSGVAFTGEFALPAGYSLTSVTAWINQKNNTGSIPSIGKPIYGRNLAYRQTRNGFSEEIRLASPSDKRFSYVTGVYLYLEDQDYLQTNTILSGNNRNTPAGRLVPGDTNLGYFKQQNKAFAAFAQGTFDVTEQLHLTVGGRYSYDYKEGRNYSPPSFNANTGGPASPGFVTFTGQTPYDTGKLKISDWTPSGMASLSYDIADGVMAYATISTGYQAAGFSGLRVVVGTPPVFDKEKTTNYEAGFKTVLFDRRLRLNANVYDLEVKGFQDSLKDPLGVFYVANAGDRRARGVEFDGQFKPIEQLTLDFAGAYLDAKYTDYDNAPCPLAGFFQPGITAGTLPASCNFTGVTPFNSPKFTSTFSAEWRQPTGYRNTEWFVAGNWVHSGSYYTDTSTDRRAFQDSYDLFNARIGLESESGKWRLTAWVKNLTDKVFIYQSTAFTGVYMAGAPAPSTAAPAGAALTGWYSPPRTYGLEASVKF